MRVSVCVGNYAAIPYKIEGLQQNVYCVEELCYCIKENAYLLDMTLMNDALVNWLGMDCGLKELAAELHQMVHKKGSLSSFVTMIMEYTGFYEADVIAQVGQVLKQGTGLSGIERRKSQIDFLMGKKKYAAAVRGYDALLARWSEGEEEQPTDKVRVAIIHNKGVALCRLMLYEQAGECFLQAFQITGSEEEYRDYLATKRMRMNENDYIAFAAGESEHYEAMLALEKALENLQREFREQPAYERLLQRRERRDGREKQSYYEESEELTRVLKNEYRENVCE